MDNLLEQLKRNRNEGLSSQQVNYCLDLIDCLTAELASVTEQYGIAQLAYEFSESERTRITAELAEKDKELAHWKSNHADLKNRLAFLTQRPDMPVDRIQIYEDMKQDLERVCGCFFKTNAACEKYKQRAKAAEKERDELRSKKLKVCS